MNEIIINPNEIESVWEKDNVCFVCLNSGKVWLCEMHIESPKGNMINTKDFIYGFKGKLLRLPLSQKGKCDDYGNR